MPMVLIGAGLVIAGMLGASPALTASGCAISAYGIGILVGRGA